MVTRKDGLVGPIEICNMLLDDLAKAVRAVQNFLVLGWKGTGSINSINTQIKGGWHVSEGFRAGLTPWSQKDGGGFEVALGLSRLQKQKNEKNSLAKKKKIALQDFKVDWVFPHCSYQSIGWSKPPVIVADYRRRLDALWR